MAWHNDRGLMGMVLDPQFTTGRPYLYVAYTYDAAIGGTAPRWNDNCTDPPGAERDGCVVSGRLSKILPGGTEQPLITDEWCQQYPSHSLGDLQFGPDGALYVSSGDGASYTFADYGQDGSPVNPCGDHPRAVGQAQTPPTAEGGALRSLDAFTTGDPTGLDGAIIRVDPDTGDPLPTNPGTGDLNARRIVAYGLRNPFRFAFRPGTGDIYAGDVGWLAWEEINEVPNVATQVTQLRLAVLRGRRAPVRLRRARPEPLQQPVRLRHARARRCTPTTTAPRSRPRAARSARRRCRASSSTTAARSRPPTTARCSSPTTRATASG